MAKRKRVLSEAPFEGGKPGEVLVVEISYNQGGANYFAGSIDSRGYWLHVRPEGREQTASGHPMRSFTIGEGIKAFLESAKRFSDKRLSEIVVDLALIEKLQVKVVAQRRERNERERDAQRRRESVAAHVEQGGGVA